MCSFYLWVLYLVFTKPFFLVGPFIILVIPCVYSQLIVNLKNKGGEIFTESIYSNASQDYVNIEYRASDGSLINQIIDYKNDVRIFRILLLGELERREAIYQSFCFITSLDESDIIQSDAISKLRQRNPSAVREAEENKGKEFYDMDLLIDVAKSSIISPHLITLCANDNIPSKTFGNQVNLKSWSNSRMLSGDIAPLESFAHKIEPGFVPIACKSLANFDAFPSSLEIEKPRITDPAKPCECTLEICIPWFPCSLKYCKNKDSNGKMTTHRCGIGTCKKCTVFHFYVPQRMQCLWDE